MTPEQAEILKTIMIVFAIYLACVAAIPLTFRFMAWRIKRKIMKEEGWTSQEFDDTYQSLKKKGLL